MRTLRPVLVGLAGGLVALAGCSDDGSGEAVTLPPATSSPASSSASPSSAPSETTTAEPTPTTTLVLPDQHVPEADAFVLNFFAALDDAKSTGDFSSFDAMYLPRCTGCADLRAEVQDWLRNGQSVSGGDWTLLQQTSQPLMDGSVISFGTLAFRSGATVRDGSGAVVEEVESTGVLLGAGAVLPQEPMVVEDMNLSSPPGTG